MTSRWTADCGGTKSALPNPNLPLYEKLREMGIPVVFFNGYYPALEAASLSPWTTGPAGSRRWSTWWPGATGRVGGIFKSDDMQGLGRYDGYTGAF